MSEIITQRKQTEIREILRSNDSKLEKLCDKNLKHLREILFSDNPNMHFTRKGKIFYLKDIGIKYSDYIGGENLCRIFLDLPIKKDGKATWFKCLIKCIDAEILPVVDKKGNTLSLNFYTDFTKSELNLAIKTNFNLIESRKDIDYMRKRKLSAKAYIDYNKLAHPNKPCPKNISFTSAQRYFGHTPIVTGYDKDVVVLSRFLTKTYVRDKDSSLIAYKALNAKIFPPKTVLDLLNMNFDSIVEEYNQQQKNYKDMLYQNSDRILLYNPIDRSPSKLDFYKKIQIIHHQNGTRKPTNLNYGSTFEELKEEYNSLV